MPTLSLLHACIYRFSENSNSKSILFHTQTESVMFFSVEGQPLAFQQVRGDPYVVRAESGAEGSMYGEGRDPPEQTRQTRLKTLP